MGKNGYGHFCLRMQELAISQEEINEINRFLVC